MKHHMKRQLGNSSCTYEEMTTLMCKIESCLNSRPLTPIGNDPDDIEVLTPGHFQIGQPIAEPPNPIETNINASSSERWRYINKMKKDFWKIWSGEIWSILQHRYKWTTPEENLRIGTIVLFKGKVINPANWPLARVIEVHPGDDKQIHVVTLKTKNNSTLKRVITNLIPLPTNDEDDRVKTQTVQANLTTVKPMVKRLRNDQLTI